MKGVRSGIKKKKLANNINLNKFYCLSIIVNYLATIVCIV